MVSTADLCAYCEELLSSGEFDDYCPNGLQVEGERPVRRLVSGVTASLALIEAAVKSQADAVLVHHGWFWKGEPAPLIGMKGRRARALIRAGAGLLAYHLPLDAHPDLGNNRQLARVLDIADPRPADAGRGLLWRGRLAQSLAPEDFAARIAGRLGRVPLHIAAGRDGVQELAWCTGAAQGYLERAAGLGVDAYLSGEVSERTTHEARELGLEYYAAGHHATERYGVQALGEHLAERFGLEHQFLDIDNPA